jgi:predicted glycoside hydrolase/deacetylase ChbG (UPF0249 family)
MIPALRMTNKLWSWFRRPRPDRRELIVNADDFGMSASVNRGIVTAVEKGIVTSSSLMVRREAATEAAAYARRNRRLGLGLHVDLGEWIRRNEGWQPLYVVVDREDRAAVEDEVRRQLDRFRDLVGESPTHLDSHQHVHREDPVRGVLLDLAGELDVPLRHFTTAVRYCGRFYGQQRYGTDDDDAIAVPGLIDVFSHLGPGVTELCCHPGDAPQTGEQYGSGRPKELATLCHADVRSAIAIRDITLRSFRGLTAAVALAGGPTDLN